LGWVSRNKGNPGARRGVATTKKGGSKNKSAQNGGESVTGSKMGSEKGPLQKFHFTKKGSQGGKKDTGNKIVRMNSGVQFKNENRKKNVRNKRPKKVEDQATNRNPNPRESKNENSGGKNPR